MDEIKKEEAAAEPATQNAETPKQRTDRFLAVSILIAGVLVGGAIIFSKVYNPQPTAPQAGGNNNAPAGTGAANNNSAVMKLGQRDAVLGSADAPVTLIEYGDYQCPFCGQFFAQTESQIVANEVKNGKVKMVFRNLAFLGPESVAAAQAAECAQDQGKLWPYHDALYTAKLGDEQKQFAAGKQSAENDGFYNRTEFMKLAQQVGLDTKTFGNCIDSNKYQNQVAQEKSDAEGLGINSTPTFYVNGQQILGAEPYSTFQTAFASAAKG